MKIQLKYKDNTGFIQIPSPQTTVWEIKNKISKQFCKVPPLQQQLFYADGEQKKILSDDKMPWQLASVGQSTIINVKNLGPQVRWQRVFFIQYLGPLIIFPLLYWFGKRDEYNEIQTIALAMGVIHYVKRQYQTAFVHVFSHQSMPLKQLMINCTHYWVFFALLNGVQIFFFPKGHTYNQPILYGVVVAWAIFEFCNLQCHLVLSSFRKAPKQKSGQYQNQAKRRGVPKGWGFGLVSCANYFWEAMGWFCFCFLTRGYTSILFTVFSVYQMLVWAIKKHKNYKKQFGDKYPKGRKAMFPFIV